MKTLTPKLDELWAEYHRTRSDEARNAIAERHTNLVEIIAQKMLARCQNMADLGDLITWGTMGLMQSVDKYDPSRGVQFGTFAAARVRGEMLDRMRGQSRLPRLTQRRIEQVDQFRDQHRVTMGREPTPEELTARFGKKVVQTVAEAGELRSIQSLRFNDPDRRPQGADDVLQDHREVDPVTVAQGRDLMDYAARNLKLSEAVMMKCYFWEGLTMGEIAAEVLNKSESRVSQMMASCLGRLREVA